MRMPSWHTLHSCLIATAFYRVLGFDTLPCTRAEAAPGPWLRRRAGGAAGAGADAAAAPAAARSALAVGAHLPAAPGVPRLPARRASCRWRCMRRAPAARPAPELSQRASAPARAQEPVHAAARAGRLAGGSRAEQESDAEAGEPPPAPLIDLRPSEAGPAGSSPPGRGAACAAPPALASLEELLGALEGAGPDTPPSASRTAPSLGAAAPCAPTGPADAAGMNGWARFGDALCYDPPAARDAAPQLGHPLEAPRPQHADGAQLQRDQGQAGPCSDPVAPRPTVDPLAGICVGALPVEPAAAQPQALGSQGLRPARHTGPGWLPSMGSDPLHAAQLRGLARAPDNLPLQSQGDAGGGAVALQLPSSASLGRERQLYPLDLDAGENGHVGKQSAPSSRRSSSSGTHAPEAASGVCLANPPVEVFSRAGASVVAPGDSAWSEAAAALQRKSAPDSGEPPQLLGGHLGSGAAPSEALWADWAAAGQNTAASSLDLGLGCRVPARRASRRGSSAAGNGPQLPVVHAAGGIDRGASAGAASGPEQNPQGSAVSASVPAASIGGRQQVSLLDM